MRCGSADLWPARRVPDKPGTPLALTVPDYPDCASGVPESLDGTRLASQRRPRPPECDGLPAKDAGDGARGPQGRSRDDWPRAFASAKPSTTQRADPMPWRLAMEWPPFGALRKYPREGRVSARAVTGPDWRGPGTGPGTALARSRPERHRRMISLSPDTSFPSILPPLLL